MINDLVMLLAGFGLGMVGLELLYYDRRRRQHRKQDRQDRLRKKEK